MCCEICQLALWAMVMVIVQSKSLKTNFEIRLSNFVFLESIEKVFGGLVACVPQKVSSGHRFVLNCKSGDFIVRLRKLMKRPRYEYQDESELIQKYINTSGTKHRVTFTHALGARKC